MNFVPFFPVLLILISIVTIVLVIVIVVAMLCRNRKLKVRDLRTQLRRELKVEECPRCGVKLVDGFLGWDRWGLSWFNGKPSSFRLVTEGEPLFPLKQTCTVARICPGCGLLMFGVQKVPEEIGEG